MARQLSLFEGSTRGIAARRAVSVAAAEVPPEVRELARQLPRGLRLGASSWHFPGWRGTVWADTLLPADLARSGLPAYAQHPLLAAAGIDRTFQAPLTARQFALYAAQVPDHFRFVVRAPGSVTGPWHHGEDGGRGGPNAHFLDADHAIRQFVEPATEGLGTTAGALLFQFPPLGRTLTRSPERFIARLHDFLERLPRGPLYAVEMRDARMITRRFFASLKDAGARYCVGVHSRMPAVAAQAAAMSGFGPAPLLVRWSLRAGYSDEDATARFAPFDRLVDEDAATRESIARLCTATLAAGEECTIIAGNKAEGSAPLTLVKLAQSIVSATRERRLAAEA
jgi:uncharacterized protein YecE (DUF72 family)